jgi:hypothetical protein
MIVIKILLNKNIQKKIGQIILHFQNEINVIAYVIEKYLRII